jgi:uncharacterized membrane protein
MEKSLGLVSQFMFALVLVAALSAGTYARSEAKPVQHQAVRRSAPAKNSLPESTVLMQHDELLPTQNRTQAMALEAENGHLPAAEEQELNRRGFKKEVNASHR